MDIERLTKTQIVLLTLLVTFVTSIATGIVTVSLLAQAPPAITQTINRVVERTVERVGSEEGQVASANGANEVTREVQVVVKENDLITEAVAKVDKSLVRIYTLGENTENPGEIARGVFLGLGVVITRDGLLVTDKTLIEPGVSYLVSMQDGSQFRARLKNESSSRSTAIVAIEPDNPDTVFLPTAFSQLSTLKLGQSAVTLSGRNRTVVATGIVSEITMDETEGGEAATPRIINTTINKGDVLLGSPLLDLSGEVVGVHTSEGAANSSASYTPNAFIVTQLEEVLSTETIEE